MINCYEILELPNFADAASITKAYRLLAKKYHPDVSSTPNSAEKFKIIAKAYHLVSTPELKTRHDQQLLRALQTPVERVYNRSLRNRKVVDPEKRKKWAYNKAQKEIQNYVNFNARLSVRVRLAAAALIMLFGWQKLYHHSFVDLATYDMALFAMSGLIFVIGVAGFSNVYYKKLRFKALSGKLTYNYELRVIKSMFMTLLIAPLLVWGLHSYRYSYHLKHYSTTTLGSIKAVTADNQIEYTFYAPEINRKVVKSLPYSEELILSISGSKIVVRYSMADPRIAKLVIPNKDSK
ncbi:MAG: hypothetical protein ACI83I_001353 [Bacteroidia bacterium]